MAIRIQNCYTFFLVARTGSMQAAAQELNVTPGAISQRIKDIEEQNGRRLFDRSRKGITLTEAGRSLWEDISAPFLSIENAYHDHFARGSGTGIRICAAPGFAYSVLVPRLGDFTDSHPDIRITIETSDRLADLRSDPIDLAIRHGLGEYPGLTTKWLASPELIVVASPELLEKHGGITTPADCLNYALLGTSCTIDWKMWFRAQGVDDSSARTGTLFEDDYLIIKAAKQGQGIGLINDVLVKDELEDGSLIKVLDATWPMKFAYYAVGLPAVFERPAIRNFTKWLEQISAE
ncbi:MAG: LysR family transcriptional regulator [Cohaesibacteraceae bacterium]|nr:LysR family transcriptional regulator [Cohaesibacteraceae bacterium]